MDIIFIFILSSISSFSKKKKKLVIILKSWKAQDLGLFNVLGVPPCFLKYLMQVEETWIKRDRHGKNTCGQSILTLKTFLNNWSPKDQGTFLDNWSFPCTRAHFYSFFFHEHNWVQIHYKFDQPTLVIVFI